MAHRVRPAGAVVLLALGGCATGDGASADAPPETDVVVLADDMTFEPEAIEVSRGSSVPLHLENVGGVVHDLVLDDGWDSGEVRPGEAVTVALDAPASSTIGWCSIPGHRDAGMELRIDVVDPP